MFKVALTAGLGDGSTHERVLVAANTQPNTLLKRLELGLTLFALVILPSQLALELFRAWMPGCLGSPYLTSPSEHARSEP